MYVPMNILPFAAFMTSVREELLFRDEKKKKKRMMCRYNFSALET